MQVQQVRATVATTSRHTDDGSMVDGEDSKVDTAREDKYRRRISSNAEPMTEPLCQASLVNSWADLPCFIHLCGFSKWASYSTDVHGTAWPPVEFFCLRYTALRHTHHKLSAACYLLCHIFLAVRHRSGHSTSLQGRVALPFSFTRQGDERYRARSPSSHERRQRGLQPTRERITREESSSSVVVVVVVQRRARSQSCWGSSEGCHW